MVNFEKLECLIDGVVSNEDCCRDHTGHKPFDWESARAIYEVYGPIEEYEPLTEVEEFLLEAWLNAVKHNPEQRDRVEDSICEVLGFYYSGVTTYGPCF